MFILLARGRDVCRGVRFGPLGQGHVWGGKDDAGIVDVIPKGSVVPVEQGLVGAGRADKGGTDDDVDVLGRPVSSKVDLVLQPGHADGVQLLAGQITIRFSVLNDPLCEWEHGLIAHLEGGPDGVAAVGPVLLADALHSLGSPEGGQTA